MTIGVTTLVSGRREHLANLLAGLARQTKQPDHVVVVKMDDAALDVPVGVEVVEVAPTGGELPLAAARNAGAAALGTDQIVLLDVDCIPSAGLVAGYRAALSSSAADGLVCGEVRYLPAGVDPRSLDDMGLTAVSRPHPARPAPAAGELVRDDQHALAWTTSLGFTGATLRLLGGFDERFTGYGGEDTDFAERARLAGLPVWWTGDATAFHQDHGGGGLPTQHLVAIVRNASLFHTLHGWWPMRGWLKEFERLGLIDFDGNSLQVAA